MSRLWVAGMKGMTKVECVLRVSIWLPTRKAEGLIARPEPDKAWGIIRDRVMLELALEGEKCFDEAFLEGPGK